MSGAGHREAFEQMLKESNYFADVINTHRRATAEVIAELVNTMLQAGALQPAQVMEALHRMEEGSVQGRPSMGSARRLVASLIRDAMAGKG